MESEEVVAELVYSFLLPEVQKQAMKDKGKYQSTNDRCGHAVGVGLCDHKASK